jgi:hypothetical protein
MSNAPAALFSLLAGSGVLQYPDPSLYQAATLLTPEERPTTPVRLIDPDPEKHPIFRVNPNLNGIADPYGQAIRINRESPYYKGKDREPLAALIAHEAEHMRRLKNNPDDWAELPAYARQLDVIRRLGYDKRNRGYTRAVEDQLEKHGGRRGMDREALLHLLNEKK